MAIFSVEEYEEAARIFERLCFYGFRKVVSRNYGDFVCPEDWCADNEDILRKVGVDYVCYGATKICIVPFDADYVIKVPFIYESGDEEIDGGYEYCKMEADNYEKAVKEGLESFFAATCYIGSIADCDVYIQEKADCNEDDISEIFYSLAERECSGSDYSTDDYVYDMDDEDRVRAVFMEYSCLGELVEFIRKNRINDLHEGNYGVTDRGYVIIDFSGYRG